MDPKVFNQFRTLVYANSGIALSDGKEAMVSARIGKRMRALGIIDYVSYLDHVIKDESRQEIVQLLNVISTNVTSFFREPDHFEFVRQSIRNWAAKGQSRFRLWSAASSTGEEPYSLAITALEAMERTPADIKILATDISTRVLEHCRYGIYSQEKLKPVPVALRERYFRKASHHDAEAFAVKDELKRMTVFRRMNLAIPTFPMRGPLDIIFCRNVMIYFDHKVRLKLLEEIQRLLRPGGYLVVGHAESLTGMMSNLKVVRPSVYMKQ